MATASDNSRRSPQRLATIISTSVAIFLVLIKLVIGVAGGSVAVLASAIDSILDTVVSIFNYFAIKKAEESPDDKYPYGKGKMQAIAGVIEGTIVTISGLFIIYEGAVKIINKKETSLLTPSIIAMTISIVTTFFLVRYLLKVAKETDNIVIKADALHYQTDLLSNGAVLLSLVLVKFTGLDWIDALFGIAIGIYIIKEAYGIIEESIGILLDRALDEEVVEEIKRIIVSHSEVQSFHWLKTRTDGTTNFVEFHMVLRPNMPLLEAHRIADQIEEKIIALDPKKRWVITPHFDPYDDEDVNDALLHGQLPFAAHKASKMQEEA